MASLPRLALRRPVATLMAYLILLVVGAVSFVNLPVDLLPKIEFTQLTVRVRYPNVGPQEIEQIITNRIENVVAGLPNLERVHSLSEEGFCRVRLDFTRGTNIDEAANDLRAALDRVRDDLPLEAEPPEILKLDLDNVEVLGLVATGTRHLEELTRILEQGDRPAAEAGAGRGVDRADRGDLPAGAGGAAARAPAGGGADRAGRGAGAEPGQPDRARRQREARAVRPVPAPDGGVPDRGRGRAAR